MPILFMPCTHAWQAWFLNVRRAALWLLAPWLAAVVFQSAGRIYLLWAYGSGNRHDVLTWDVLRALTVGLRFDIKVATIVFTPLLALSLVLAAHRRAHSAWMAVLPAIGAVIATAIAATAMVNALYVTSLSRRIDVFVFGLFDDDTAAILKTLWHGYPVIPVLLVLVALGAAMWWLGRRWREHVSGLALRRYGFLAGLAQIALIIAVAVMAGRGSLGTFPLRMGDTNVSTEQRLNDITANGISAFHSAWRIHKHAHGFWPVTPGQESALFERFLQRPSETLQPFMARTSLNPAARAHPPHVVLQIMESMGAHLHQYDGPQRDLLGALRQHWNEDWRFDRFLSEGNGTIDSLSRLLVRSPVASIGQTMAGRGVFASNAFTPFLDNGYRIVFVTSGPESWRNLKSFALNLGAHEFVGQRALLDCYPEARAITWGVPDEYMFRYIESRLARAERAGEHLFVIALSATHHPPFELPSTARHTQIDLTDVADLPYFSGWQSPQAVFKTLHYANDQLGQFLGRLKAAPLGQYTVVGVTGDHNILGVNYSRPEDTVLAKGVPFYLYVPPRYQSATHYDSSRVGSHKDIFPTLYHLSLPETAYYRTGCNLLAQSLDPTWCFGFNHPDLVITEAGAFQHDRPQRMSPWTDNQGLAVGPERDATPAEEAQRLRLQTYRDLLRWQIDYQVQHGSKPALSVEQLTPSAPLPRPDDSKEFG